jgi:hypothetical protein
MASPSRRPLPIPPSAAGNTPQDQRIRSLRADMYESSPYYPHHHSPVLPNLRPNDIYDKPPTTTLPGGTLLHQGFYDLLAMIPTPSPSRLFWGAGWAQQPIIAGPQYEDLSPRTDVRNDTPAPPISAYAPLKKGRRISKDMVSKPTGFVCV